MKERAINRYALMFSLILCCAFFLGCAAYQHGYDTSAYKSLGWIKVTEGDTYQQYSGYKRLQNAMDMDRRIKAFINVNGLPDYLLVKERKEYHLAYLKKGQIYQLITYSDNPPSAVDYSSYPGLPVNITAEFISHDKRVKRYATFQDAVSDYEKMTGQKALYVSYENAYKWSTGQGWPEHIAEQGCNRNRKIQNLSAPCVLFARNDEYFWDKSNPLIVKPTGSETKTISQPAPQPAATKEEKVSYESGTGFAVRSDGYILTCYHVVKNADVVGVYYNSKIIPAKLTKYSRNNDLALLKIEKNTPHYLELDDSGNMSIGSHVFTIGFPVVEFLGIEPKYTDGTISSLSGMQDEASFMQISVPVQPGNSGGPLVNDRGKVVGIITSRAADIPFFKTTGSLPQNINWAVKAEIAKPLFRKSSTQKKYTKMDRESLVENTRKAVYLIVTSSSKSN